MDVNRKIALVTGASSGIGEATVKALARKGATVVLVARREDRLRAVAEKIAAAGGSAEFFAADLSDPGAVARLAEGVRDRVGVPDILVNNAGAGRWLSAIETSPQDARQMIELPYLAAFYVTHAFLPEMLVRGSGHVVNVTSVASYLVWPNAAGYIAARQALKGFTDALRAEVETEGVFVSLAVLGTVESSYWRHNPGSRERVPKGPKALSTDAAADAIIEAIEQEKRRLTRPAIFRLLFVMEALFPGSTVRG